MSKGTAIGVVILDVVDKAKEKVVRGLNNGRGMIEWRRKVSEGA